MQIAWFWSLGAIPEVARCSHALSGSFASKKLARFHTLSASGGAATRDEDGLSSGAASASGGRQIWECGTTHGKSCGSFAPAPAAARHRLFHGILDRSGTGNSRCSIADERRRFRTSGQRVRFGFVNGMKPDISATTPHSQIATTARPYANEQSD